MNNRQVICDCLIKAAEKNQDVVVACSDSRGSGALTPFAEKFPEQFVEMGIAEQNLVTVSAGLASCGKKVFAASPASFLSTRSYEQVKVDVAYSDTDVKLIGISGGVSYGALGMTHHSCQDIAALSALPNMRVYLPSDRFQTEKLMEALMLDGKPAYVRVSRSATADIYDEGMEFTLNRANIISEGADIAIIACGEMVPVAVLAAKIVKEAGIDAGVIDMHCIKPLDEGAIIRAAERVSCIVTVEEHSLYGGLGSRVAQIVSEHCPKKVINIALPDGHIITGTNHEVFKHYGMDENGIVERIKAVFVP